MEVTWRPPPRGSRNVRAETAEFRQHRPREFAKLIEASGVRLIKFHGLRHTSATLALKAGVPVKVVAQRLGHAKTDITNDIYAHALPSMQKDAAAKLSSLLR